MKKRIAIISSSVRDGRLSHRVALFVRSYLGRMENIETDLIDLLEYDFPVFHERFAFQKNPSEALLEFAERFNAADGLIIVTPVYNADFPAALKNVIDLFYEEWKHRPVATVSVTSGMVPPIATIQKVQSLLLKLDALVVPGICTVTQAGESFAEDGTPTQSEKAEGGVRLMVEDLLWLISSIKA